MTRDSNFTATDGIYLCLTKIRPGKSYTDRTDFAVRLRVFLSSYGNHFRCVVSYLFFHLVVLYLGQLRRYCSRHIFAPIMLGQSRPGIWGSSWLSWSKFRLGYQTVQAYVIQGFLWICKSYTTRATLVWSQDGLFNVWLFRLVELPPDKVYSE